MKFGGSSVADAERIVAVGEIVRARLSRRPVVVVSALAGVTDLLERALELARRDDLEALEPILADLERRHRWALTGSVETPGPRHALNLELDRRFEDLRQRLRSIRILGELSPRAADGLLAAGESLAAQIVAAVFRDRGLPARVVDAGEVMITDERFGAASPQLESIRERCREHLEPMLERGQLPVLGGFIGATSAGETTTLGRGGSDTSAAVLGLALRAEEIQIWSDVNGLMTADPRRVPAARTLERVSFAEAAELAFFGARVLHPASIAPAVARKIPVRVLNSLEPDGPGTVVLDGAPEDRPPLASVASRRGVRTVRVADRGRRVDPQFLSRVLEALRRRELAPDLVVAAGAAATLVLPRGSSDVGPLPELGADVLVEPLAPRAMICAVGYGLERPTLRETVLRALAEWHPDLLALGASGTSVAAVVGEERLDPALHRLHQQFFEAPG